MSITATGSIQCRCGKRADVLLVDSLNAVRHPHLRQEVLDRRLHLFHCGACGEPVLVEKPLCYVDFDRRQLLGVFPRYEILRAREHAEEVMEVYHRLFQQAPGLEERRSFLVRVCFGYEELREKLVGDEAGLSDLAVEALKVQLLTADPWFAESSVLTLRLDQVDEAGRLHFQPDWLPGEAPDVPARPVVAERSMYDAVNGRRDELLAQRPCLASGPHVSLLRLFQWPDPDAG